MNMATKHITDILKACGCAPTVTQDNTGADIIKINAPVVNNIKKEAETLKK